MKELPRLWIFTFLVDDYLLLTMENELPPNHASSFTRRRLILLLFTGTARNDLGWIWSKANSYCFSLGLILFKLCWISTRCWTGSHTVFGMVESTNHSVPPAVFFLLFCLPIEHRHFHAFHWEQSEGLCFLFVLPFGLFWLKNQLTSNCFYKLGIQETVK